MGTISQMAEKCQKCPERDKCDHKIMCACAYVCVQVHMCTHVWRPEKNTEFLSLIALSLIVLFHWDRPSC